MSLNEEQIQAILFGAKLVNPSICWNIVDEQIICGVTNEQSVIIFNPIDKYVDYIELTNCLRNYGFDVAKKLTKKEKRNLERYSGIYKDDRPYFYGVNINIDCVKQHFHNLYFSEELFDSIDNMTGKDPRTLVLRLLMKLCKNMTNIG